MDRVLPGSRPWLVVLLGPWGPSCQAGDGPPLRRLRLGRLDGSVAARLGRRRGCRGRAMSAGVRRFRAAGTAGQLTVEAEVADDVGDDVGDGAGGRGRQSRSGAVEAFLQLGVRGQSASVARRGPGAVDGVLDLREGCACGRRCGVRAGSRLGAGGFGPGARPRAMQRRTARLMRSKAAARADEGGWLAVGVAWPGWAAAGRRRGRPRPAMDGLVRAGGGPCRRPCRLGCAGRRGGRAGRLGGCLAGWCGLVGLT